MKTNPTHFPASLRGRGSHDDSRGRTAAAPQEIPPQGWFDVLKRVASQIKQDHLGLIAAGVGFFLLLGLFPGLAALVSIYSWVADPASINAHINQLSGILPGQAAEIIRKQAEQLSSNPAQAGWGAVLGVVIALWAGSKAMKAVVEGVNIAYKETEDRGAVRKQLVYLGLTLAAVLMGILAVLLIAVVPAIESFLPLPDWGRQLLVWARWPVLLLLGITIISIVYRFGPSRRRARWKWVSWGAGGATVAWLIVSALFSVYVSNFGNYNETYGSLSAVVVLMMWLYLTAFLMLIGAEVNAELEHQTTRDTTTGGEKPMGSRDAYVADHVAPE
jgi:membrane protein